MSSWVWMVVAVGLGYLWMSRNRGSLIESSEAHRLVKDGALLVDVRTPGEYRGGHIEGAVNIPLDQVQRRVNEFGERDKPVVVYCRSGARSGNALRILESQGFTHVYNLGGMGNW